MNIASLLSVNREKIINKWAITLQLKFRERYRIHTREHTAGICAEGVDASYRAIVRGDFSEIDRWAEKIAGLTIDTHMQLSAVQNDCDLYRAIVVPILVKGLQPKQLSTALKKLNLCAGYTITRFSDYFEALYHKEIREYADNLEQKVIMRSRELAESETKYRILVEEINDGYFVNLDDKIVFANKAFCQMHGYERREVIGRNYIDLVALESVDRTRSFYERRLNGEGVPKQYTYFRRHNNGSSLPTENKVEMIQFQGKQAVAGICRDITERIRMEQKIRDSENLARIGQLTSSLAHEIRNPLSSIKMSIQLAMDAMPDDQEEKRGLEISTREMHRLEGILSEMLDFARPLSVDLRLAAINDIVRSSLLVLDNRLKEKSITVKENFVQKLPAAYLDEGKIEQALINLLLNAIEAVPEGGRIRVRTGTEGPQKVWIRIADNGPGVDSGDLLCLFNPFFTKKKNGTGLGLFNVKKIVEAHKGTVTASRSHKGLVLTVLLPTDYRNE